MMLRKSKWRTTKCSHMNPLLQFHHRCCCFSQTLQGKTSLPCSSSSLNYVCKDRKNEGMKILEESKRHASLAFDESLWLSFFATPHKWYDCRVIEKNQNGPDFRCIDTGKGLWIEAKYTPLWVKTKLTNLKNQVLAPSTTQNLWKMLFANPSKWIDYRKIKKSNNHPDFVHKHTRNRLWITDIRTPTWARLKLNNLQDEVFAPFTSVEKLWSDFFTDPSKWLDKRKIKISNRSPDFMHKDTREALWIIDSRAPSWVIPMLNNLQDEVFASVLSTENLWKMLFADPSKWFDNRKKKKNERFPDFVHKYSEEALWIDSTTTPSWVLPKLNGLTDRIVEGMWKCFFADPTNWVDTRIDKKSNKHPDFKHKDTGMALWIQGSKTPAWVKPMLKKLQSEAFALPPSTGKYDDRNLKISSNPPNLFHERADKELQIDSITTHDIVTTKLSELQNDVFVSSEVLDTSWSVLFANPSKWFDKRTTKKHPEAPDFKHRDTHEGLRIDCKSTPAWAAPLLSKLGDEAFASSEDADEKSEFLFVDPSIWFCNKNKEKGENAEEFTFRNIKE